MCICPCIRVLPRDKVQLLAANPVTHEQAADMLEECPVLSPVTNVYVKLSEHRETLRCKRTGEGEKRRKWSLCTFRHSNLMSVCLWLCSCVSATSILPFFPHINIYIYIFFKKWINTIMTNISYVHVSIYQIYK